MCVLLAAGGTSSIFLPVQYQRNRYSGDCKLDQDAGARGRWHLVCPGFIDFEKDVGYGYVNIDDCYSEKKRSTNGDIVAGWSYLPHPFIRSPPTQSRQDPFSLWNEMAHGPNS